MTAGTKSARKQEVQYYNTGQQYMGSAYSNKKIERHNKAGHDRTRKETETETKILRLRE